MRNKPAVEPRVTPEKKSATIDSAQAAFDIRQLSLYTGLSVWQCRSAIWAGTLPARRVGKNLIILRPDADAFLKSLPPVPPSNAQWLAKRKGRAA